MISSNLSWVALADRLALFWITNTIQKVTTVVVVLMKSCHVSEKLNSGPVSAQPSTSVIEAIRAGSDPNARVSLSAARLNRSAVVRAGASEASTSTKIAAPRLAWRCGFDWVLASLYQSRGPRLRPSRACSLGHYRPNGRTVASARQLASRDRPGFGR
jgi:hypothetical protein